MTDRYAASGVGDAGQSRGFRALVDFARKSYDLRPERGRPVLPLGAYANVLDIGTGLGIAVSTDGVGTKLLIASAMGRYDTVGIDCVAMNVNDVLAVGAEPIAVLDYLAVATMDDAQLEQLGRGLYEGVRQAGCSIPGGELAQVGSLLHDDPNGRAFDLVATAIGLVQLDQIIDGARIAPGDAIYGLAASGLHSNGYSLARQILLDDAAYDLEDTVEALGRTVGEELLEPTRIYVKPVLAMLEAAGVHGLFHITGDGVLNLLRVPAAVEFRMEQLPPVPPVFALIAEHGQLPPAEMYRVFNMGVGFVVVAPREDESALRECAAAHGQELMILGEVAAADEACVRLVEPGLISRNGRLEEA